ncbi:MAG: hypothetical protein DRZ82_06710 [Thermoprotei archaeon]|nr:MAG: hypothetical protein DRZ82_06710 [Thermoprotei archaeon]
MRPHCEVITKFIIPAIRALVAIRLAQKYEMTQLEIAKKLGVTQPAISYYLHSKRGRIAIEKLKSDAHIMKLIERLADLIYNNRPQDELQRSLCEICMEIRSKRLLEVVV